MRDLLPGRDGRAGLGVSRVCRTLPGLLVVALLTLGHPSLAAADSIYLKNGRVIRTPRTEVVGDKLVFLQYGAEITIPMDLVDRIELDDQIEEAPSPPRQPSPQGSESADGTEVDAENSAEDGAEGSEEDEGPQKIRGPSGVVGSRRSLPSVPDCKSRSSSTDVRSGRSSSRTVRRRRRGSRSKRRSSG